MAIFIMILIGVDTRGSSWPLLGCVGWLHLSLGTAAIICRTHLQGLVVRAAEFPSAKTPYTDTLVAAKCHHLVALQRIQRETMS